MKELGNRVYSGTGECKLAIKKNSPPPAWIQQLELPGLKVEKKVAASDHGGGTLRRTATRRGRQGVLRTDTAIAGARIQSAVLVLASALEPTFW